jgi:hypothetical protein
MKRGATALIVLVPALVAGLFASTPSPAYAASPPWSVVSNPGDDVLRGIACSSSTACVAVGGTNQTIAESWNGKAWTLQPTQNPGLSRNLLYGVSCAPSICYAVGDSQFSSFTHTLIEVWDGSTWQISPSPNTTDLTNILYTVSCVSATFCMAVGNHVASKAGSLDQTLAESWNGTAWQVLITPSVAGISSYLSSVSCTAANSCVAVGYAATASGYEAISELWNGTAWTMQAIPTPGGTAQLNGVTCTSATNCTAVGYSGPSTLIEDWNGTGWAVAASPNSGSGPNALSGITCQSTTSCTSVGSFWAGTTYQTLVETFNGSAWQVVLSANFGADGSELFSPQCPSVGKCMAVGDYFNGVNYGGLVESTIKPSVKIAPNSGPPGLSVTLMGGGFASGESVSFTYETGLTSPKSVVLCEATANASGAAKCSGAIPSTAQAGATGQHLVVGQGSTSGTKASVHFTLT